MVQAHDNYMYYYAPLIYAIEFDDDGNLCECKVIANAYVMKVLDLLQ